MKNDTVRKTTKKQLREAVDSFLYRYSSLTGGTREEIVRQAPRGLVDLEEMARVVANMASNPAKLTAADSHLMRMALETVPGKIPLYRRYVPGTAEHAERLREIAESEMKDARAFSAYQASEKLLASAVLGVEVEEVLAGADSLPENVILFPRN